ncbi:MAG: TatD family nuclease-associated radical SAM protein [bacterium]
MKKHAYIIYLYKDNLYLNITNKCSAHCLYCIKNTWEWNYRSYNLKLAKEPTVPDILQAVKDAGKESFNEIVFCGYGEPLFRLDVLKETAAEFKKQGFFVRINTSGHANLIHGRNILPELHGIIDAVSISLNGETPEKYMILHKPQFGIKTFNEVINFIKGSKKYIPSVVMSVIDLPDNWQPGVPGIDVEKCRKIAEDLNVEFRVRPYLRTYEKT